MEVHIRKRRKAEAWVCLDVKGLTLTCRPAASAPAAMARSCSSGVTRMPAFPGWSEYGWCMKAVREPRLPSWKAFTWPQCTRPLPWLVPFFRLTSSAVASLRQSHGNMF